MASPIPSRYRKTKIIATLGPASSNPETIKRLILAGVNLFRLNFSHGSHEAHGATLKIVREVSDQLGMPVAALQDLSGPKIRISPVEGDVLEIKNTSPLELKPAVKGQLGSGQTLYVEGVNPCEILKVGHQVLLADGICFVIHFCFSLFVFGILSIFYCN